MLRVSKKDIEISSGLEQKLEKKCLLSNQKVLEERKIKAGGLWAPVKNT